MEVKRIQPAVEDIFRRVLGHSARAESELVFGLLEGLDGEQLATCTALCAFVAGYTAIDVVGREWPNEESLRKIAKGTVKTSNAQKLGLTEQDVYDFVARVSLRFEPIEEVFPDPGRMVSLPFYVTAHILGAFGPIEEEWWEFLDMIEAMYEMSENSDLKLAPALMLRARRTRLEEDRRKR
jgi:hypothetical protein